jgi:soluble lytic murein transglycosylase
MRKAFFRKTMRIIPPLIFICILPVMCDASDLKPADKPEVPRYELIISPDNDIKKASDLISARSYREAEEILIDIVKNSSPAKNKALFLLGKLYMEEGSLEKAENYTIKAVDAYPLLRDYSLRLLTDIYMAEKKYEKAVGASRQIKNSLLLQSARQTEIKALLSLKKNEEAEESLIRYVEDYPSDWDHKLTLAMLMKDGGEIDKSVGLLKDIYMNAAPLSNDALKELNNMKAVSFSKSEILKRADNLFDQNNFQKAEIEYQKALKLADETEKEKIILAIGTCRFRSKRYAESADSFGKVHTPEAMYWQAYSYYRSDKLELFEEVRNTLAEEYPGDERIALLLLMQAEEFRRKDKYAEAETLFREVVDNFPAKAEDALWGLGWTSYMSRDYKSAANYFSKLADHEKSENYYKYLYWLAKSNEKINEECLKRKEFLQYQDNIVCDGEGRDFFSGLPSDRSFYGYLINMHSSSDTSAKRAELARPSRPGGEVYDRIDSLALLGMREEAVNEIIVLLNRKKDKNDFFYLCNKAMELNEYRKVISLTEKAADTALLPYSFPLGFSDIIEESAGLRHVDKYLVAAVIREESRFDPDIVSWAGAVGLMQIMPATAYRLKKDLELQLGDQSEIHDVKKNIILGTYYLSTLINDFKQIPFAIVAYNAGENALKKWMTEYSYDDIIEFIENIPYKETRFYVKKVLRSYWQYRAINGLPVEPPQILAHRKS